MPKRIFALALSVLLLICVCLPMTGCDDEKKPDKENESKTAIDSGFFGLEIPDDVDFGGKTVRVLCDGVSKTNENAYSGRTEEGKIVFFEGEECDKGNFVMINIERAEAFALYGQKRKEE